jgi:hypothetical protein
MDHCIRAEHVLRRLIRDHMPTLPARQQHALNR